MQLFREDNWLLLYNQECIFLNEVSVSLLTLDNGKWIPAKQAQLSVYPTVKQQQEVVLLHLQVAAADTDNFYRVLVETKNIRLDSKGFQPQKQETEQHPPVFLLEAHVPKTWFEYYSNHPCAPESKTKARMLETHAHGERIQSLCFGLQKLLATDEYLALTELGFSLLEAFAAQGSQE